MTAPAERQYGKLYDALGHSFSRPELLGEALTHPSAGGTGRPDAADYERFEFLGDRVLGLVVSVMLLDAFPDEKPGALARRHTALVRAEALASVARQIGLGACLAMAPSEEATGGREKAGNLADCCEAVIAALFLDAGMTAAERFIHRYWGPLLARNATPPKDAKTELQEWVQAQGRPLPTYDMVDQTGPDHEPVFTVRVTVEGFPVAPGSGVSKRAAEQRAAEALLRLIAQGEKAKSGD